MSRTVPVLKRSVLSGPESLDLFNILDVDPTKPCPPTPPPQEDLAGRELYDFYTDSTLLITGGTGFLGRVLLQKLLRTFAIKRIYLLVRRKDTTSVEERMNEFFQEVIYDKMRAECPNFREKIIPIESNFEAPDLGLDGPTQKMLFAEVQIIFNIIASVKFNENLKNALNINVLGTRKVLQLAMHMQNLKSFLHVSTFYCNCDREFIGEKCYNGTGITYDQVIRLRQSVDTATFDHLQHCLIGDMPNTYTVTKKWSENMVNHLAIGLPAGIYRPPIVIACYKDPIKGWTDNINGPCKIVVWTVRGYVHCIHGDSKIRANMVPVDYCINSIIAVAWDISKNFKDRLALAQELPVYNYLFHDNNFNWGQYMKLVANGFKVPLEGCIWYYSYFVIKSDWLFKVAKVFLHYFPAALLDVLERITGRKRRAWRGYSLINRAVDIMAYFGLRKWDFSNNNILKLSNIIEQSPTLRDTLGFHCKTVNWAEFFLDYIPGVQKHYFKITNPQIHSQCRRLYRRLKFYHEAMKILIWCLLPFWVSYKFRKRVLYYVQQIALRGIHF